ncbi:MAG: DUF4290 domain-containing protein [Bacteroidales bacterium]|nr:DUF4290 domain-containing protein [Bacteroidales bacterium]
MNFDYNTSRQKLILPEYGRNIQKMVNYIKTIEDRDHRNKLANSVVAVMGNLNPHLRDINDFKHKLWDHLAIISDFELDIDYPYEIPRREMFIEPPRKVPYGTNPIRFKHYGRSIELMIKALIEMDEGDEKDELIGITANHMKKSYLTWNRESVEDEVILNDMNRLAEGKLNLNGVSLSESRDLMGKTRKKTRMTGKKK